MTVVFGCLVNLFTPNFPEKAQNWFLKPHERERLIAMLEASRGKEGGNSAADASEGIPAWRIFLDWRIQLFTLAFFCCDITASSVSAFSPTILTELGYRSTTAQLMTMPVWASGIVASFTVTFIATRANKRWPFVLLAICLQIAGWTIFKVYPPAPGVRYLGLFFGESYGPTRFSIHGLLFPRANTIISELHYISQFLGKGPAGVHASCHWQVRSSAQRAILQLDSSTGLISASLD